MSESPDLTIGSCEVCGDEPAIGVAAVPGVPVSAAYGRACLEANAHPWRAIVFNTAACGGLENTAEWWRSMVHATLAHLGRPLDEFDRDVLQRIAELREAGL
jgi:hypothetical protein